MSVVKVRVVLRRHRREGEKSPHRIRLDSLTAGDSLLVEVVAGKEAGCVYRYLFSPQLLSGRRGITFRESGNEIYWLSGLKPKMLLQQQAEALLAGTDETGKPEKSPGERLVQVNYNVLVFGVHNSLVVVYRTLDDVAAARNLRAGAIDKLSRTKRASTETGYSFRYRKKKLDLDLTDFTLTLSRYDELCRRKPKSKD